MWWLSAVGTLLLATALTGVPVTLNPDAELISEAIENVTLSTELLPPPMGVGEERPRHGIVYLINIYAVTNSSDLEDGEEELTNEIIETTPGILEPVATVLLVVEADDEEDPVSLDDIAKDLEAEGFTIEKITKDGETQVIKVDFGDVADDEPKEDLNVEFVKPVEAKTSKVRRKRAPCLKCKLGKLLGGGGGGGYGGGGYGGGGYGGGGYGGGGYGGGGGNPGYGGGGCGGSCGGGHQGGSNTIGVIPVLVVPVQGYPSGGGGGHHGGGGGGGYHQGGGGGGGYPSGGGQCDVCGQQHQQYPQGGGGGGGGGGGHGGSWSQASAQASAQSSSGSW